MIKSKPGKQFAAASQALCLQVLTDDPGDNTYGHTPLHIQTGDRKSTRLNSSHMPKSRMPSSA